MGRHGGFGVAIQTRKRLQIEVVEDNMIWKYLCLRECVSFRGVSRSIYTILRAVVAATSLPT